MSVNYLVYIMQFPRVSESVSTEQRTDGQADSRIEKQKLEPKQQLYNHKDKEEISTSVPSSVT